MKTLRITVMRKADYADLQLQYERPIEHACAMQVGQTFLSENAQMPQGMCESAWQSIYPFALTLACGGGDFYDGWMQDSHSAMISCNDGFRPVSFYIEVVKED
ncbi:MAG: TIGR04076 family protein [Spirochaetales bacterium]|nr:TIGR04076 family protein [Spirochaetales bacterium]